MGNTALLLFSEWMSSGRYAALHTEKYYLNITPMLQPTRSEEECRLILRLIAKMLVDGTFGH